MKRFKHIIVNFCKSQRAVFFTLLAIMLLPNALMLITESTSLLTRIINVVMPLGAYWLALALAKKPGKAFWWLLWFAFLDAFQLVLLYLYGESPIAVDMFLNVLTTNPNEAGELLGNLMPAVAAVIVVYGGAIALAVVSVRNSATLSAEWRKRQRRAALCVLAVSLAATAVNHDLNPKFQIEDDIFPINGTYNMALAFNREQLTIGYHRNAASFSYHATTTRDKQAPEIYVLIIGETARACNFGLLGYDRNTTPRLSAMRSELAVFANAMTMSNTTHKSVPLLLSPVGSQGNFELVYRTRGLISAYSQAGYRTVWLSNQRRNHSMIDFMGCEAQQATFIKDGKPIGTTIYDDALLPVVAKELAAYQGGKLLIVVHSYGSHFNYRDRYPASCARFKPDSYDEASPLVRSRLLNAYDNAILHTDSLVAGIIAQVAHKHVPAGVIYVSDHGEDIYDDARHRFLHASPLPTYWQLHVPYIVWASTEYRQQHPGEWQQLLSHQQLPISTSRVNFHTLLHMSGLKSPYLRTADALTSGDFTPQPRLYVNDHDELVPLDESGIKDIDRQQFHKAGIRPF